MVDTPVVEVDGSVGAHHHLSGGAFARTDERDRRDSPKAHDAAAQGLPTPAPEVRWQDVPPHLHTFWQIVSGHVSERHRAGRLKQWLNFLRKHYPDAESAYMHVRTLTNPKDINAWFETLQPIEAIVA